MKRIMVLISLCIALLTATAYAQMQCQTFINGQTICTPAGGGSSSYR